MSLFSTGIMAGAAVAAASAEPLFSWLTLKPALAMAGVLALLALMLWLPPVKQPQGEQTAHESVTLSSSRTGLLLLFFGVGTGAYTLVLARLPPLYIQAGWSARSSGYMLAWLTLTEVAAGFAVSALIGKFPDRRVPLITVLLLLLAGLLCLVFAPEYDAGLINLAAWHRYRRPLPAVAYRHVRSCANARAGREVTV